MTRYLLDTQVLIWVLIDHPRLTTKTKEALSDPGNTVFFSAATIWEIAIKRALGKIDFLIAPDEAIHEAESYGFVELPVLGRTALLVGKLPLLHRDPFDRLLVVQAMANGLTLLTADPWLPPYSPLVDLIA